MCQALNMNIKMEGRSETVNPVFFLFRNLLKGWKQHITRFITTNFERIEGAFITFCFVSGPCY